MAEQSKRTTTRKPPTTQKHPGGRPLKFKTVKELEDAINEYFDWCDNRVINVFIKEVGDNVPVSNPAPYTMSGLAYALGVDRQTILNYEDRDSYSALIKRARARVEQDVETRLLEGKNQAGAIFNLKNNFGGWKDKTEQDLHVKELPKPILGGLSASGDGDAIQRDNSN